MFTGIIEETGVIRELTTRPSRAAIMIAAERISGSLTIGASIAVNGVCLTVINSGLGTFSCELSPETLRRSSFDRARPGTLVNLERPLLLNSRLDGHLVQGHVDGVGKLLSKAPGGEGIELKFTYPQEMARYLVYKGSIAVDGISLTISFLNDSSFAVAVIPHTLQVTNLQNLRVGDSVNLEADIIGKYFERFFQLGLMQGPSSKLTMEYLKEQGF